MTFSSDKLKSNLKTHSSKIQEDVRHQIQSGTLKGGQRIDIRQLAEKWGVSTGTVSQSLQVLAATGLLQRKRRIGTYVSKSAQALHSKSRENCIIHTIVPKKVEHEYLCLTQAMLFAANKAGFISVALGADNDVKQYGDILRQQIEHKNPIAIVPPLDRSIPVDVLVELYNSRLPVVTCHRSFDGFGWPLVGIDIAYNTEIATQHLCEIGRKHIGLLGIEERDSFPHLMKEHAFLKALDKYGLSSRYSRYLTLTPRRKYRKLWQTYATETITKWLSDHPELDSICALHDSAGWAAFMAAEKLGRKVPDDLAIIGNGNFLLFGIEHNDLSSIEMCYDNFADTVVDMIKQMQHGEAIAPNTKILIKGKLIARHSTLGDEQPPPSTVDT